MKDNIIDTISKKNYIIVNQSKNLKNINITTEGYPGFPTDLQQPFTVLLTQCDGMSYLKETIYENRFNNIKYLNEMGANGVTLKDNEYYFLYRRLY